jgi:hypothetical protein
MRWLTGTTPKLLAGVGPGPPGAGTRSRQAVCGSVDVPLFSMKLSPPCAPLRSSLAFFRISWTRSYPYENVAANCGRCTQKLALGLFLFESLNTRGQRSSQYLGVRQVRVPKCSGWTELPQFGTNVAVRDIKDCCVCIRDLGRKEDTQGTDVHQKEA